MDSLDNTITLIFGLISSVAILIYYLNPKQSKCFDCESVISHQKENRYSIGEENALCKICFNKRQKLDEQIAKDCTCCSKKFTTRMKIHEWDANNRTYFLCSSCNRKGKSKITNNFQLHDILTDEFIKINTDVDSLQKFIDNSGVFIGSQKDLNSAAWDDYIVKSSKFSSWKSMESRAVNELYSRQRKCIIDVLSKNS